MRTGEDGYDGDVEMTEAFARLRRLSKEHSFEVIVFTEDYERPGFVDSLTHNGLIVRGIPSVTEAERIPGDGHWMAPAHERTAEFMATELALIGGWSLSSDPAAPPPVSASDSSSAM